MKKSKISLILALFFVAITVFSQNPKRQAKINNALQKETIEIQFNTLIEQSPTYQNFKNIRLYNLNKFKANVLDTIKVLEEKFTKATTKIASQQDEINTLNQNIAGVNKNLSDVTQEKDSISVFGINTTKATYNTTLWSIILGLLLATIIFLFKFRSSNIQTKEAKSKFKEIEDEFDIHRKKSLEREQVLRRKLQDEINKQRSV